MKRVGLTAREVLADARRAMKAVREASGSRNFPDRFNQPVFVAETRRLGLSEEKNRRQSPQRVADNDNGRKWPREKQTQNLLPQSRDQLPRQGEWEEWHGWEKSGLAGGVVKRLRFSFKEETATSPNRDDVSNTDRAEFENSTLPVNSK